MATEEFKQSLKLPSPVHTCTPSRSFTVPTLAFVGCIRKGRFPTNQPTTPTTSPSFPNFVRLRLQAAPLTFPTQQVSPGKYAWLSFRLLDSVVCRVVRCGSWVVCCAVAWVSTKCVGVDEVRKCSSVTWRRCCVGCRRWVPGLRRWVPRPRDAAFPVLTMLRSRSSRRLSGEPSSPPTAYANC